MMTQKEMFELILNDKVNNYKNAFDIINNEAQQNTENYYAIYYLGYLYNEGFGVKKDIDKAIEYYGIAADNNIPGAQFNLGLLYREGHGPKTAKQLSLILISLAADQGHSVAQHYLARLCEEGKELDLDYEKAYALYFASGMNGYVDAFYDAACLILEDKVLNKNNEDAFKFFKTVAEHSQDIELVAEAYYKMGLMYYHGEGVTSSIDLSIDCFINAANKGHKESLDCIKEFLKINNKKAIDYLNNKL